MTEIGLSYPAGAQPAEDADLPPLEILEVCARDQADTLPNPFPDVQPTDWAYKAVLTLYYCGAYRGAIPPEQYLNYLQRNADPSDASPT